MFLPYPSSAFVLVETMPGWPTGSANNQPVTPVIEDCAAKLLDTPCRGQPLEGPGLSLAILVAAVTASGVLFGGAGSTDRPLAGRPLRGRAGNEDGAPRPRPRRPGWPPAPGLTNTSPT